MKDKASGLRKKARFVVEARYAPALRFLDTRGAIIESIFPAVRDRFPHWQAEVDKIVFHDPDRSADQFSVGSKQTVLLTEDVASAREFAEQADRFFALAHEAVLSTVPTVGRLGVRFVEIIARKQDTDYGRVLDTVQTTFYSGALRLPIEVIDSQIRLIHKRGQFGVGPTRKDDAWVKAMFQYPDKNVPAVGFALDVDSFAENLALASAQDWLEGIRNVMGMTLSTEEAVLKVLGVLND